MPKQKESALQKTRSLTDRIIEKFASDIWIYVRENKMSLDSERGRKMIGQGMNAAVAEIRAICDDVSGANDQLRKEINEVKKQMRAMAKKQEEDAKRAVEWKVKHETIECRAASLQEAKEEAEKLVETLMAERDAADVEPVAVAN